MKGEVKQAYTIFDSVEKELIIPVYQRNYDWSKKQCERLFDDLETLITENRERHFFGSIVGNPETSFKWVVIDGQQRLTRECPILCVRRLGLQVIRESVGVSHG
ncbi:DUF262 domain-containing protein [Corynebacterium striatum]|uniref:DUF262 domain-containing protein n=1 Tax=Corynebacterium striatum TaxID=43770 RepID=UPI00191EC3AE|nr:DUF262 domain-containing protein [Corynebacterium striatum]QQU79562.1 DUF262 domain-containing protein [Corynebacterium striatum]